MKLNLTRTQIIQAIVIIVAVLFVLSTLSVWFGKGSTSTSSNTPSSNLSPKTEENITIGMGKVALIVDGYSPILKISKPSDEVKLYLEGLRTNGSVLYVDESNQQYTTLALSNAEDVPAVASKILALDSNASMFLEAYVYSDKAFEFTTQEGTKISASVPRSKITVVKPYPKGALLYFNALVQLYNGTIVGAKLSPLAQVETAELLVLPKALMPEHYVRLYFMWHDRNNVANNLSLINESLIALGATDVKMQYTSDITVYGNDSLSKAQVNELRAKLPNLKVVQFNKIVFYDNVTYTEDEISEAVYNVTNGSVNVSFSPPMLEMVFSYTGNESALGDAVNAIQPAPLSKEIYRVANASTGNIVVNIKGKDYSVNSMYVTALVPHTASVDVPVSALFEVTIVGDEIVGAKPIVANKYTASG